MQVGAFGLGVQNTPYMDATGNSVSSLLSIQGAADYNPAGTTGVTVLHIPQGSYGSDLAMTAGGKARGFIRTYGNYQGGSGQNCILQLTLLEPATEHLKLPLQLFK